MPPSWYITKNDFRAFDGEHYFWLGYAVVTTLFWIWLGRRAKTDAAQQRIGFIMCVIGIFAWVWANAIMAASDQMKWQSCLPFHLCYFLNLTLPFVVYYRRLDLMDWVYPIVMAGCLQALFTPDLDDTFPHYFSVRYWLVHTALVQALFYGIAVYGFRPTARGILKCALFLNVYALCMVPINWVFGTNFLYIKEPAPHSIMESLGPWPQYLIWLEVLMFVFFVIVYIPFGWLQLRKKRVPTP
jgi:hypothetical integral membrane protein (TIGR02206 family)